MPHRYVATAKFRSPYSSSSIPFGAAEDGLGGLGDYVDSNWPKGRSYYTTADFRAPYDRGFYQDNTLFGLGDDVSLEQQMQMPADFRRYVQTGEPMPELMRDVGTVSAQIPRWAWGLGAAVSLALAYRGYKGWKKARKRSAGG